MKKMTRNDTSHRSHATMPDCPDFHYAAVTGKIDVLGLLETELS